MIGIPQQLQDEPRWIVWKKEKRNGKATKVPYDAKNGAYAKSNDSATWTTFAEASSVAAMTGEYDGCGFMLFGSKYVGLDFDGVVDDGVPEPYILSIIAQLGDPYTEVTPSGTGLRVFIECPALPPGNRKFNAKKKGTEKYGAEIYAGSEGGRYLTVTGDKYAGNGIPVVDNLDLVYFLMTKFPDEHFRKLWLGDATDYENDASRVDLALLGIFARAFNGDVDKMVKFFNASVPGHREKWLEREDYRQLTIDKAKSGITMSNTAWQKFVEQPRTTIAFHSEPPLEDEKQTWTAFDYVVGPLDGQFDGWFPLGSPSLIGGSSGSGKTTWMLDLCVAQAAKRPFYDHQTFGRQFLVLMLDRGAGSHARTMMRLGFRNEEIPIKFLKGSVDGEASQQIIDQIEATSPRPQLVFVEGMDMLVSDANALEVVMPFMHEMQMIAERFHIALVGSVGAPKTKPRDGYVAKRDTIFGSAVWSRMSETIVTMQYPGGDDTADRRAVAILPRNAKAEAFETEFSRGRLVIATPVVEEPEEYHLNKKEREEQTAQSEAEDFIMDYLQDGPREKDDVLDAAREMRALRTNVMEAASARLLTRGVIAKTQKVVETAHNRAIDFILDILTERGSERAGQFFLMAKSNGFNRKMLEEVSAELVAAGQITKTPGAAAVWTQVKDAKPMQTNQVATTKWVWSLTEMNATKEVVVAGPDLLGVGE